MIIGYFNKVIEMNEKSSQSEIDMKCRLLSRKWHPDKYKDPIKKEEAENKFMAIQASCNLISDNRKSKIKQNEKST
jgi:DnaJ-class molecular chaperone